MVDWDRDRHRGRRGRRRPSASNRPAGSGITPAARICPRSNARR